MNLKNLILINLMLIWIIPTANTLEWTKVYKKKDKILYRRMHPDYMKFEYKLEQKIKLSAKKFFNAVMDFSHYQKILPNILESRVVKKENNTLFVYLLLDFTILKNREYILEINNFENQNNKTYLINWTANNEIPINTNKKNVRLSLVKGQWNIKGIDENNCLITYSLINDWKLNFPAKMISTFEQKTILKNPEQMLAWARKKHISVVDL